MHTITKGLVAGLALLGLVSGAGAQDYPSKPIRWIVPYPAGGGTDVVARTVGAAVGQALGQTIVVENKPGANTIIGAQDVARAKPDGYTLGSADNATLALNQSLYDKLPYQPQKDFSFVGGLARFPYVLLVHPSVQASSLKELIDLGRREPGKLTYGTPGMGGPNHVAMELLQQQTGAKFTHAAYRGAAPALQDLISGQIHFMLVDTASSGAHIRSGRVKALAASTEQRIPAFPDVPTFAEAGLAGFLAFSWQGVIAPAGTPAEVITKVNQELNKALASEDVTKRLAEIGVEPTPTTPEAFAAFVTEQEKLWGGAIRSAGIKLEN